MNSLQQLFVYGQSVWLDYIRRDLIRGGQLREMIERDGLRGMTSNPAIFEKSIAEGHDYDEEIARLSHEGQSPSTISETLSLADVREAADVFRPLYESTSGGDGYVSFEVDPHLARDTAHTIEEARHWWRELDRPNIFIKVPATREGLPAIRQLISEGININVTLLFGLERYREVAEAYLAGLEDRLAQGHGLAWIASVASFFVSRIDTLLDPQLEKIAEEGDARAEIARELVGEVAIANAKVAYQISKEIFGGERFQRLVRHGARPQRLLWASTSTKNPRYSDVKYVEALIGEGTVNTMPLETFEAYRDHGQPHLRLVEELEHARWVLEQVGQLGIEMTQAARQLEEDGVRKFTEMQDKLVKTLALQVA